MPNSKKDSPGKSEEVPATLLQILKEFSKADLDFVICGGVACVFHGVERATYDIDINVSFEKKNLDKLIGVSKKFKFSPRISEPIEYLYDEHKRAEWFEKKGAMVYTFVSDNNPLQIDIFLSYPLSYKELFENADEIEIDGIKFKISSIEDLIFVKKLINPSRDKDLIDIKELEKINEQKNKSK